MVARAPVESGAGRLALALVALVAVGWPAGQAQEPARARVGFITPPEARRPAEVSIAINPTNPDHVVAAFIQSNEPGRQPRSSNWSYVSVDGGLTWTGAPAANPERRVQGDDVVVFGRGGTLFHGYIAFDGIRVARPERAATGIWVRRSTDGGSWESAVPVVDHVNTVAPFEDKPWLAVDRAQDSPHRGNLYVAWTRFDVYGSKDPQHRTAIWFARSRDGGRSFEPPTRVSDETGDAVDSDNTMEGAVPAIGPKGEVYLVWAGPNGLYFDRSDDGGWTFGHDRAIGAIAGGWDLPVPGAARHNGMPVTMTDLSRGPHRGSLYVNFIDERSGDADVWVMASRDGGATWERPVRANDDRKGAAQMFTWMAVDAADGSVNLVYHDRSAPGLSGTATGVTVARSVDGGRTFATFRLPVDAFDCCDRSSFFGDYNGIDAVGGRVVAAFPVLTPSGQQRIMAAALRFKPGTLELLP